jgi:hypothetical protein
MTLPGAFAQMMLSRSRLARTSAASAHELDPWSTSSSAGSGSAGASSMARRSIDPCLSG